nr:zinc finger, CCHC-type [Tanacetum cinerariifolium]
MGTGGTPVDDSPTVSVSPEDNSILELAILGCHKDFRSIANSRIICRSEGFSGVDIKYLGGLWVLFVFKDKHVRDKFINHKGIHSWFTSLEPPDIAFAVGQLSKYTSNPSALHWQAQVFQYLKGTMDYGLTYSGYPSVIEGYSDASWINNTEDHSSTSGWVFLLGGGAISWASKKQTYITGSTMESEFVALAAAGKEAEWLRNLVYEITLWPKLISTISI